MKLVEEECDQTDIRLAKYGQNSERTSSWNNQSDIVQLDHILSGWAINYLAGHTLSDWRSLETQTISRTLSGSSQTMYSPSGQYPLLSPQTWFLNYGAPNWTKLRHKGHLNTRNKFPNEVFPKFKDFPSDFRWIQKPRFWGNEEKSMKSKGLDPWIHSKIEDRWWGSS
jgi:hypothetical protein